MGMRVVRSQNILDFRGYLLEERTRYTRDKNESDCEINLVKVTTRPKHVREVCE
jgi:hypothetical protein